MRKRNIVLSLTAAPAVAVLISSCASPAPVRDSNLTVQCTENLTGQDVTGGNISGTGTVRSQECCATVVGLLTTGHWMAPRYLSAA
jgi:hypothetical protein